jgi:tight adherence protein B
MSPLLVAFIVTLCGGAAAVLGLVGLRNLLTRARMAARAHAVAVAGERRASGTKQGRGAALLGRSDRGLEAWIRAQWSGVDRLETRLAAAGVTIRLDHFLGLVLAAGGLAALLLVLAGSDAPAALLLGLLGAGLGARSALLVAMRRRRRQFLHGLPDALGLMVRGLRAGLPVVECVGEVGHEVGGPVGAAFTRASEQVRLGQPLEKALLVATRGLDLKPMAFLAVTLSIQRETGGNLAETLAKLDSVLRRREQMELKVRAMSSEARASALIIGLLPPVIAILMWLVAPAYVAPLFTTGAGRVMLGAATLSLVTGGWLMAQMVRFDLGQ